jgi:hypothetical protein
LDYFLSLNRVVTRRIDTRYRPDDFVASNSFYLDGQSILEEQFGALIGASENFDRQTLWRD